MNQPELYARSNSLQIEANTSLLEKYLKNVNFDNEKLSILDVGTGDGYALIHLLLKRIPKECQDVIGVDISQNMVEYADQKYSKKNVKFFQMDISNKNLPKELYRKFHNCFSFFCLQFVHDKRIAYKNVFDILKPNGSFLGWYVYKTCLFDTYVKLSKYPEWSKYSSKDFVEHFKSFGDKRRKAETEISLKEIGFKDYFVKIEKMQYEFNSIQKYKEFLISVNPIIANLEELEKEKYIEDCINETRFTNTIKFVTNGEKEKVLFEYELLVVYASKI